jgi:hypothetical protein
MIDEERFTLEADRNLQRSRYYGAYYGTVEDNDDPEELGRLKVRIPQIHSTKKIKTGSLPWAMNAYSKGGGSSDRGEYNVPDVGSQVLIVHVQADPDHPVCIGTVWGSGDTLTEVAGRSSGTSGPHGDVFPGTGPVPEKVKCIKTSTGHKMIFDDNPEHPDIIIETSSGHVVTLDDKTERRRIELQTVSGHNIFISDLSGEEKIEINTQGGHTVLLDDKPGEEKIETTTIGGHHMILDDTPGSQSIQATTILGHDLLLDDVNQKITLTSNAGHLLDIDDKTAAYLKLTDSSQAYYLYLSKDAGLSTLFCGNNCYLRLEDTGEVLLRQFTGARIRIGATGRIDINAKDGEPIELTGGIFRWKATVGT